MSKTLNGYILKVFPTTGLEGSVLFAQVCQEGWTDRQLCLATLHCREVTLATGHGEYVELRTAHQLTARQCRQLCAIFREACVESSKKKSVVKA